MIKRKNMCRLFAALTILSLATIILPSCDCGPMERYIVIYEDGTAELHQRQQDVCGGWVIPLSPEEVAYWQSQGVIVRFFTDQARRNWEARGYSGRGGGTDQPPQERHYEGLPPLDVKPGELPSNTIELTPGVGQRPSK